MGISLHPEHLRRYRDLALLIAKYGRPDMVKQVGLDETIDLLVGRHLDLRGRRQAADAMAS